MITERKGNDEFAGFDIIEFLGEGSYGKVYRAMDVETGLEIGLKIINVKALESNNCLYTLSREISALRIAQKRNISNIIRLYSHKQTSSYTTLVLEYASLGDLSGMIKCYRALPEDWTRFIIAEIILGLEGLHTAGFCHRDIKPSNILITRDGHVRIADFGTAKSIVKTELAMAAGTEPFPASIEMGLDAAALANLRQEQEQEAATANMAHPQRGSIYGTVCYNAPESNQAGLVFMTPLDVWGVGCILYECLTGVAAFMGDVEMAVVQAIETRKVLVPRTVSSDAADLIRRLLTKDPMKRFQGGWRAIKQHPFFSSHGINFGNLQNRIPPFNPSVVFADLQQFKYMKVPEVISTEHANMLSLTVDDEYRSKDSPLRRFLIPGENIIYSVDVIKRRVLRLQKQRRFVLTDFPRLFYIDTSTMVQKGEIDMTSTNLRITRIGERIIEFTLGRNCFTAEVLTKELCDLWLRYLTMYSINGNRPLSSMITNRNSIMSISDQDMRCGTCKGRLFRNGFCNACGNVAEILHNGNNTVQYILKMDPRWLPISEKEMYLRSRLALTSDIQPEMDNMEAVSRYERQSSVQKAVDRLRRTNDDVIVYRNKSEPSVLEQQPAFSETMLPAATDNLAANSLLSQTTPIMQIMQPNVPDTKDNVSNQLGSRSVFGAGAVRNKPVSEKEPMIYENSISLTSIPNRRSSTDLHHLVPKQDIDEQQSATDNEVSQISAANVSLQSQTVNRQSISIQVVQKQEKDLFEFFHANRSASVVEDAVQQQAAMHGEYVESSIEIKTNAECDAISHAGISHTDLSSQQTTATPFPSAPGRSSTVLTTPLASSSHAQKQEPQQDLTKLLSYMVETSGHASNLSLSSSARASIVNKKEPFNPIQSMILGELPELPMSVATQSSHIRITTTSSQAILGSHSHSVRRLLAKVYAVSTAAESLPYPTLPLPRILGYCGDRMLLQYSENIAVIGKFLSTLYVTINKQGFIPALSDCITKTVNPLCLCICTNERRAILNNNIATNYDLTIRHTASCYTCGGDVFKNITNDEIINDALLRSPGRQAPNFTHIPSIVFPRGIYNAIGEYINKHQDFPEEDSRENNDNFSEAPRMTLLDDEIPLVAVLPNCNDSTNSCTNLSDRRNASNITCMPECPLEVDAECDPVNKTRKSSADGSVTTAIMLRNSLKFDVYGSNVNVPIPVEDLYKLQFGVDLQYYNWLRDRMSESLAAPNIPSYKRCEATFPRILSQPNIGLMDKWYRYFAVFGLSFNLVDETYKISKIQDIRYLLEMNFYHKQVSLDVTIQYDDSSDGCYDFDGVYPDDQVRSSIVSAVTTYTAEEPITSTATSVLDYQKPRGYKLGAEHHMASCGKLSNRQPYIHYCRRCTCSHCVSQIERSEGFITLDKIDRQKVFIESEFGTDEYSFELFKSWVSRRFAFQFLEGNFPLNHECRNDNCMECTESSELCNNVNLRLPFYTMTGLTDSSTKKITVQIPTKVELDEYWCT